MKLIRSAEFLQCTVFLIWSLFELAIVVRWMISRDQLGMLIGFLCLTIGAIFLIRGFVSVVRQRLDNPDAPMSSIARVFLYTSGTLAIVLQATWYLIHSGP